MALRRSGRLSITSSTAPVLVIWRMSVMGFFRRRDFVSRSGRKSAALSNCHDALTAALELLPRRRVRANDRFRGPEELFMRHEFVTRAATIVVGAGLMLGGCAT